jgi:hypothetical protein
VHFCWFILYNYITMHGAKKNMSSYTCICWVYTVRTVRISTYEQYQIYYLPLPPTTTCWEPMHDTYKTLVCEKKNNHTPFDGSDKYASHWLQRYVHFITICEVRLALRTAISCYTNIVSRLLLAPKMQCVLLHVRADDYNV